MILIINRTIQLFCLELCKFIFKTVDLFLFLLQEMRLLLRLWLLIALVQGKSKREIQKPQLRGP